MFCHVCGHRNPFGVNFCSSCGAALVTVSSDTTVSVQPVNGQGEAMEDDTGVGAIGLPRDVAMLMVKQGPYAGLRFVLDSPTVKVGRHPESDIFLDDITVSRQHAEFLTSDATIRLRDLGSLNGTYVNRQRIEETVLSSGDEVQIGKFKLVFLVSVGE